jgi:hypothetical protein
MGDIHSPIARERKQATIIAIYFIVWEKRFDTL